MKGATNFLGALLCCMALACAGCASYKTTLTNAQGDIRSCEARSYDGTVTGQVPKQAFDACVANAIAAGYKEQ